MSDKPTNLPKRPLLARFALWGVGSRSMAWAFVWICAGLAAVSAVIRFWFGLSFLLAGLWYWMAIRWADKNDGWK